MSDNWDKIKLFQGFKEQGPKNHLNLGMGISKTYHARDTCDRNK